VIGKGVSRISKKNAIHIPEAFEKRRECVQNTIFASGSYFGYVSILGILYLTNLAVYGNEPMDDDSEGTSGKHFSAKLLAYLFACRGILDFIIWFQLTNTSTFSISSLNGTSILGGRQKNGMVPFDDLDVDLSPQLNLALRQEILHFVTCGIREAVSHTYDDFSSNHKQYHLTKDGVRTFTNAPTTTNKKKKKNKSITKQQPTSTKKKKNKSNSDIDQEEMKQTLLQEEEEKKTDENDEPESTQQMLGGGGSDDEDWGRRGSNQSRESLSYSNQGDVVSIDHSIASTEQLDDGSSKLITFCFHCMEAICSFLFPNQDDHENVVFDDHYPHIFHQLREISGVRDSEYLKMLSSACRERLSEGASGSFMFESANRFLLVKTIDAGEADHLREILVSYHTYLNNYQNSFLVRFFGLHSLQIYSQTFHFVVMKSVFPIDKSIHLRYDIKGSWVSRNGKKPKPYQKVFCRHCGELFIYGDETTNPSCLETIGKCEPNMILKDNDLSQKLKLVPEHNYKVITTINKDVDFLSSLGCCDYSLLVGVQNFQFMVDYSNIPSHPINPNTTQYDINYRSPFYLPQGTASFSSTVSNPTNPIQPNGLSPVQEEFKTTHSSSTSTKSSNTFSSTPSSSDSPFYEDSSVDYPNEDDNGLKNEILFSTPESEKRKQRNNHKTNSDDYEEVDQLITPQLTSKMGRQHNYEDSQNSFFDVYEPPNIMQDAFSSSTPSVWCLGIPWRRRMHLA